MRTPPEQRDDVRIAAAVENLKELWRRLDRHLAGRPFVAGEDLTMGDIPVGAMCHRYHALGVERDRLEHVEAWYGRLTTRAAYRAHVMLPLS